MAHYFLFTMPSNNANTSSKLSPSSSAPAAPGASVAVVWGFGFGFSFAGVVGELAALVDFDLLEHESLWYSLSSDEPATSWTSSYVCMCNSWKSASIFLVSRVAATRVKLLSESESVRRGMGEVEDLVLNIIHGKNIPLM